MQSGARQTGVGNTLARARVVLTVGPDGVMTPVKNTLGSLTNTSAINSFVQSLCAADRRALIDALRERDVSNDTGAQT